MTDNENKLPIGNSVQKDELDLIKLARELWNGRKLVWKTTLVFMVLGLLVALFSAKEYQVTTIMVPQSAKGVQSKLGGLSSLAAMAGFNLNLNSGSELSPMIYPQIVQSIPFKKTLMQTKLNIQGIDHPVTYYDYYTKYAKKGVLSYITGFPGIVLTLLRGKPKEMAGSDTTHILSLTPREMGLAKKLQATVYANVDQKNGYITLTAIMPQALAAAELAQRAQALLQQFITEIKIKKGKAQLDFIKGRYEAKKKAYDEAQMELAMFQDQNKNISTATAASEQTRLTNNYQLAYGVYSQLAQELENAEIQVKDDTPVFSIIEPVTIPNLRFKPKRAQILLIWTFFGVVIGIGLVFGKKYWEEVKDRWKETN
ncbi:MAG: hypothetical protein IH595_11965 [Bacteroidales bacterium]|nr:hypothetical protein [Bacteroidales bacterium]